MNLMDIFLESHHGLSGSLYGEMFNGIGDFQLRENSFGISDYVFGDRKSGGNSQSITRNRWIHHTSS
ncbi:hypothetical protein YC2023_077190 [Brassica napus]